jgi:hypothetical protein
MDALVKITKVEDVAGVDPTTLAPRPFTKVTYMVGDHGPFTLVTPSKDFTPQYVENETTARVVALRAIGAIAP